MSVADEIRASAVDRPRFRGVLHTWCFVISVPVGIALFLSAPTAEAAFAAGVFAFGVSAMFGSSALFHRTIFDDHSWYRFRRLDHMGIYLCIAGGYTPFALLALDGWQSRLLLIAGWSGAAFGICLRFLPFLPPFGMMNALFITLGWVAVLALPELWDNVGTAWLVVIAAGGLVYTLGALAVGARWPDPWPRTFGYHEVWHVAVAVAVSLHYSVVAFEVIPGAG